MVRSASFPPARVPLYTDCISSTVPGEADATERGMETPVRNFQPSPTDMGATDTQPSYDIMGNKTMTLPKRWPLARPQLATHESRLHRPELRLGYAWAIQKEQHVQGSPVLPPCTWCGQPTGGYCDLCTTATANAVCSVCGGTNADTIASCRRCAVRA